MFPLGGAGQTRRRRQPLTNLTFLPLAFKDFYYQTPPIQGLELPLDQTVHTALKTGRAKWYQNKAIKHPSDSLQFKKTMFYHGIGLSRGYS